MRFECRDLLLEIFYCLLTIDIRLRAIPRVAIRLVTGIDQKVQLPALRLQLFLLIRHTIIIMSIYSICKRVMLILLAVSFLLAVGCSHIRPYYSEDVVQAAALEFDSDELAVRFLLIGDTDAPDDDEPVLDLLTEWSSEMPEKTVVAFLGDNIYPSGMPKESDRYRAEAERRLNEQLRVLRESGAEGWFIPGNHD